MPNDKKSRKKTRPLSRRHVERRDHYGANSFGILISSRNGNFGFTLLEVMVALSIIAIGLAAVLGTQSQSVSLAGDVKFGTTAALLAQKKIAENELKKISELRSDSGDFGEDFPGYNWEISVQDANLASPENVSEYLKQIDLKISWAENERYVYRLRLFVFTENGS